MNTGVACHFLLQCMKVKSESEVAQLCLTLIDSMDCSPPGSSVHGIFQARVLEWGAIAFSACELRDHLFNHILFTSRAISSPCIHQCQMFSINFTFQKMNFLGTSDPLQSGLVVFFFFFFRFEVANVQWFYVFSLLFLKFLC